MKTKSRVVAEAADADAVGEILNVSTVVCKDGSATITTTYADQDAPPPATGKRAARKATKTNAEFSALSQSEAAEATNSENSPFPPAAPQPEPVAPTPTDPAGGVLVRDCTLAITGLPGAASAYHTALDLARIIIRREPAHAVTILDAAGAVLFTIDAAHLAAVKAAKATRAPSAPREPKAAPEGKRAAVVALCMRHEGASTKELVAATGWHKAPWAWTIGRNKNGTGLADRYGYGFSKAKVGDETRYFLTPTPAFVG